MYGHVACWKMAGYVSKSRHHALEIKGDDDGGFKLCLPPPPPPPPLPLGWLKNI